METAPVSTTTKGHAVIIRKTLVSACAVAAVLALGACGSDDSKDTAAATSTSVTAATSAKSKLRRARDTQGRKLDEARASGDLRTLDGYPIEYAMKGQFPLAGGAGVDGVRLFGGDWDEFVVGVRSDITMKILDQAVIQDNTGAIIYNLAQQDMTAVRLTFRVGWQVSNPINNEQATEASRYPAGVLKY